MEMEPSRGKNVKRRTRREDSGRVSDGVIIATQQSVLLRRDVECVCVCVSVCVCV